MATNELSSEFDVLYNNITSNQAPGLNEYEKSVFLTKAQRQLVTEYFNNRTDVVGGGFDGSQKRQYDFSALIRTASLFNVNSVKKDRIDDSEKLDKRSLVFLFPHNYFLAVNELLSDNKYQYSVLPLDYAEYQRLMLKPYNFPVKRGAWRLITDKKNCNYCEEFVTYDDDSNISTEERPTDINYVILSSWADQKRNLEATIIASTDWSMSDEVESFSISGGTILFKMPDGIYAKVNSDGGWSSDKRTYQFTVTVYCSCEQNKDKDDEYTIKVLQEGFRQLVQYKKEHPELNLDESEPVKVMNHIDGFAMCSAPSKFLSFQTKEGTTFIGRTFTTHHIELPMVEIIGKFSSTPDYKLRYVRTLTPIVLDDLTNYGEDLTIEGYKFITECELPVEMHHEILERAVTLAKIAWSGGTSTQAAAQQQRRSE